MTRGILRIASVPSSTQSGSILIACSMVMFGVALLTSAALRSLEDGISLMHNAIDRQLAHHAADAALHDAALMLAMMPDQLTLAEVQGAHSIGEVTGETYVYGGYLQPCALPEYVVEVISAPDIANHVHAGSTPSDIYRVTAHGKGHNDSTTVTLQADFAVQFCKTDRGALQNTSQEAQQGAEPNAGEDTGQIGGKTSAQSTSQSTGEDAAVKPAGCVPGVRRLAWRLLQAT